MFQNLRVSITGSEKYIWIVRILSYFETSKFCVSKSIYIAILPLCVLSLIFDLPYMCIFSHLSENPYICDCSMVWFLREPAQQKEAIKDVDEMKCTHPKKVYRRKITELKEEEICSASKKEIIFRTNHGINY